MTGRHIPKSIVLKISLLFFYKWPHKGQAKPTQLEGQVLQSGLITI